jgi:hypothetical protein
MAAMLLTILLGFLWLLPASAQFGFFDQMFGHQQQHQQQQRPAGGASYYTAQSDAGSSTLIFQWRAGR